MSNEDLNDGLENDKIDTSLNETEEVQEASSDIQENEKLADTDIMPDIDNQANVDDALDEQIQSEAELPNEETNVETITDDSYDYKNEEELSEDGNHEKMITVRPVKFQHFEITEPNRSIKRNLDIMQDVSMHISVELGKTKSTIKEVMDLTTGSIVELDKIAGEQVEIYANNKLIARGEVIVIEDKFGVRVTSTNIPKIIQ